MKKIINGAVTGTLLVGLLLMASNIEWVREAWAQAKTVMYKDSQQTVTVAHIYNNTTPNSPPLTVTGNSLGIPALGFAPDMIGNSPVAGLGALTGPDGQVRRLTDGGAQGALVVKEGSVWDCEAGKAQKIHIVTCPPYNAKGDGVANDSVAIQSAIGNGGRTVLIPPGTYLAAGLYVKSNLRLIGGGMGITTLKLPNQTLNGVLGSQIVQNNNVEIAYMTIDGNVDNQTMPNYASFGFNGVTNIAIHHVESKNSSAYCLAMEHGIHTGTISDSFFGPCRWDGIDIKNEQNQTRMELNNIQVSGPGTTFGASTGQPNAVCVDSGGRNRLSNIKCTGLKNQTYGISFRRHQPLGTNCTVSFCEGGDGSTLTNFFVDGDGSTTTEGAGVLVRDDHIQISNGYINGMGRGVYVESDPGAGTAWYVGVTNVFVNRPLTAGFATDTEAFYTSFVNCSVVNSQGSGAIFNSGSVRFISSAATDSIGSGITIGGTSSHIKVEGSTFTGNNNYGVYVGPGIGNSLILGNTIVANGSNIADSGTNTIIQNNYGVKTADNGQVTLPAGATSVVVTHGLNFTPEPSGISLTAMGAPTTPVGTIYVDAAASTATTFTIKSQTAPGGAGLPIGWRAIVKY